MSLKQKELPTTLARWKVPDSWEWVTISDVGQVITGNTPPTSDKDNYGNDVPYVKPPELVDRGIRVTPNGLSEKGAAIARVLPAGAVLVSCIGGLGKTGLAKVPLAFNQQINAIIFNECVMPEYGFYYTQTLKKWLQGVSSATTLSIVNKGKFQRAPFPFAPLEQQKGIVAEIEKQFSRLDEAVANLKRVKANLKRYKAAVLKAAVEGKLTEEWRRRGDACVARSMGNDQGEACLAPTQPIETGAELLQRILAERREKWQGRGKYKEPVAPDTSGLPELSEGWVWASVDQITTELMNGYGKRAQAAGFPRIVLRLADISEGKISFNNVRRINCEVDEILKYKLEKNDLLILRVNGSPDLVGRLVLAEQLSEDVLYCDHFIRVRCVFPIIAGWLRNYSDAERYRKFIEHKKVSSAGQNTIAQGALKTLPIPLPPLAEQHQIVAEVERRLSIVAEAEAQVDANLRRAERLRQSILNQAFSGQLITPDCCEVETA